MSDPVVNAPVSEAPRSNELASTVPLAAKIKNEIILNQRLENLNVQASNMAKAFINSFLRERSKEFKEWTAIGEELKTIKLTEEGKLRLTIKHELMEDRVVPHHSILLMTAAPFLIYWALKKGATYLVSSRIEAYQKTQTRLKKRMEQSKQKQERRASKGLPPTKRRRTKKS